MTFSFTGLAYLLGFFAVGLLSYRFFQYWQEEKSVTSRVFFYFTAFFAFFMLVTAVAGLFFATNTQILKGVVIFAAFIQTFALSTIGYLVVHLKFPQISPWVGAGLIFLLGSTATILTIVTPFNPYLEPDGGINWDIQPLADTFRFLIFLITFIPLIIILGQQIRTSDDPFVKAKALGLIIGLAFGILTGLFDFFLENVLKLGSISSDVAMGGLSIVMFIVIFFTQKPPPKKEEKYTSSSPKIPW